MPLELPHLASVLARAAERDEAALGQRVIELAGRVHDLALRLCGGDAARAERLTEDTFWCVWREAPRFDPAQDQPAAWVLSFVTRSVAP
jgi:DNA-directed RNA polymerase specialized sigma24 family protein